MNDMTLSPKITVIIPTRERGDVLGSALASVTAQDYANLTILVSNNFSSDHTRAVVEENPDPRIRKILMRRGGADCSRTQRGTAV